MAVAGEYCNYCEQAICRDIEHIYPKSLYPSRAFSWENYLYACKGCNMALKNANFAIFQPQGSATVVDITGLKTKPVNSDAVFINPRVEDPMQYFSLNLMVADGKFRLFPPNNNKRAKIKFEYTRDLLGLNENEGLVTERKNAIKYYIGALRKYVETKKAKSFEELEALIKDELKPYQPQSKDLEKEKARLCLNYQKEISTKTHQTVWEEIKRQRFFIPKIKGYFKAAPEALNW